MAQKYQVNLPLGGTKEEKEYEGGYLTVREAAFIARSVRLEIEKRENYQMHLAMT